MARLSLQQVVNSAAVLFADNTTKQITPAKMRQFISELTTAIRPAYGYVSQVAPVVQALIPTPKPLVMTASTLSPVVDFTCDPALCKVTRNDPGMTNLTFTADIQGSANVTRQITFTLYRNGVATTWRTTKSITTATLTEGLTFSAIDYLNGVAEYQILVSSDANYSVSFSNAAPVAEVVPVWTST